MIDVEEMSEAIVGGTTCSGYKYNLFKTIEAACDKDLKHCLDGWITPCTEESYESFLGELFEATASARDEGTKKNQWIFHALRNCHNKSILNISLCRASSFMGWLQSVRNNKGQLLSKSAYGNRWAALHDLFRCHANMEGFPPIFEKELKSLKKGFFCILTKQNQDKDDSGKSGKRMMLCELYTKCCQWFLEKGTQSGIFAHCFLVITWNLLCRLNNTSCILFKHITF